MVKHVEYVVGMTTKIIKSKPLVYSFNKLGKYVSFDEDAGGRVRKHTNKNKTVNIWV